jgi:hypothetical protein
MPGSRRRGGPSRRFRKRPALREAVAIMRHFGRAAGVTMWPVLPGHLDR